MRWTLLAAAATLLFAGFAGVVSATNPCTEGTAPTGASVNVCVLNTEGASYGYYNVYRWCDWWLCYEETNSYAYSYDGNTPASAGANQPLPIGSAQSNAAVGQSNTQESSYYAFGYQGQAPYYTRSSNYAMKETHAGANDGVFTSLGHANTGANFQQLEGSDGYCESTWICYSNSVRVTEVGASENVYGPILGYQGVGFNVRQSSYNGGSCQTSGSANTHTFGAAWNGYIPNQPCVVNTPAGPVDTEVPQLYSFCQATGAPDPALPQTVCTKFPAWDPLPTV